MEKVQPPSKPRAKVSSIKRAREDALKQFGIELWPLDRPKPYENNPRVITEEAIEATRRSLLQFGWRQVISVCAKEEIVAGHTRRLAAIRIHEAGEVIPGWPDTSVVPVHPTGMDEDQARAYRIADNRTGEFSEWDEPLLQAEFAALDTAGFDLGMTAFEADALQPAASLEPGGSEIPEPPKDNYREQYGVIVVCGDEQAQQDAFAALSEQGYECRVVVT